MTQTRASDKAPDRAAPQKRGSGNKWRCHKCGHISRYWAAAERHADAEDHPRIECVI